MPSLYQCIQDFLELRKSLNYSTSTLHSYKINITRFIKWLNRSGTPDQITENHLRDWLIHLSSYRTRQGLPLKPASINKNIDNIRRFLEYLISLGHVRARMLDILKYVKEPDLLPSSVLTHDQVKSLISGIQTNTSFGFRD